MLLQVKIVMAAINTASLIVTLLCPSNVTPLVLLTTIASAVTWAFTKTDQSELTRRWQFFSTAIAATLTVFCIVLGVTAKLASAAIPQYTGQFVFTFDETVAVFSGKSFDYIFFAVVVFLLILFLTGMELAASYYLEKEKKTQGPESQPLARVIRQELTGDSIHK